MLLDKLNTNDGKPIFNKKVTFFFIKLFVLFSVWFVCYFALLLQPGRKIDRPLTNLLTAAVTKGINIFSSEQVRMMREFYKTLHTSYQKRGSQYLTYLMCVMVSTLCSYMWVFFFLLPYPLKRKIVYSIGGIAAIIILNIVRIFALFYFIYVYQRSAFDFSHHYLFTLLMYVLIFYGWWLFVKKSRTYDQIKTT